MYKFKIFNSLLGDWHRWQLQADVPGGDGSAQRAQGIQIITLK